MATQTRRPTGEGAVEWTPSAGTNWSCVGDQNDATYVSTTGTDTVTDVFTYAAFDFSSTSINKLSSYVRYKDTGANATLYSGRLIINGSYYYGAIVYGGADWADYSHDWLTNPETSAEWTLDELNGIGVGGIDTYSLRGNGATGVTLYVSECALIADYEPAAAAGNPFYYYAQQ